jgi:hypothetical protein
MVVDGYLKLSFGLPFQLAQPFTILFGAFAVLYVDAESVPPGDVAPLVPQWHTASPKPAIFPISRSAETYLVLEWLPVGQAGTPQSQPSLKVFVVYCSFPTRACSFLGGKPSVFRPVPVREYGRTIRQSGHCDRRHCFDQIAKLPFTTMKSFLGASLILDIVGNAIPSSHLTFLVSMRHAKHEMPAIFAVRAQHALLQLERLARRQVSAPCSFDPRQVIGMNSNSPAVSRQTVL